MKIMVRLGEPLWRQVGKKSVELEFDERATVEVLLNRLLQMHPTLTEFLANEEIPPTIFLNDELVERETPLQDGDCPMVVWAITGG